MFILFNDSSLTNMKKFVYIFFIVSLYNLEVLGQSIPKNLNYQAVVLNPSVLEIPGAIIEGQVLPNSSVCLKFTLLNAQEECEFEETQTVSTDEHGLISVQIGKGNYVRGQFTTFEKIRWDSNVKSLHVSLSYDSCQNYLPVSKQLLTASPFALYADAVEYKNIQNAPHDLGNLINDVGYQSKQDLVPLNRELEKMQESNNLIKKSTEQIFLITNQKLQSLYSKLFEIGTERHVSESKLVDQKNQLTQVHIQVGNSQVKTYHLNTDVSASQSQVDALKSYLQTNTNLIQNQINEIQTHLNSNTLTPYQAKSNLSTNIESDKRSILKYPSVNTIKNYVDSQIDLNPIANGSISGNVIASDLVMGDAKISSMAADRVTGTLTIAQGGTNAINSNSAQTNLGAQSTQNMANDITLEINPLTKYPNNLAIKDYIQFESPTASLVDFVTIEFNKDTVTNYLIANTNVESYNGAGITSLDGTFVPLIFSQYPNARNFIISINHILKSMPSIPLFKNPTLIIDLPKPSRENEGIVYNFYFSSLPNSFENADQILLLGIDQTDYNFLGFQQFPTDIMFDLYNTNIERYNRGESRTHDFPSITSQTRSFSLISTGEYYMVEVNNL